METSILHNGDKGVANCIMGSSAFIAMTPHKRWIPVKSIGCVHTHRRILTIEGWGSPSHVRSVVQKIREDNRKAGKTDRVINQMLVPRSKHNKNLGTMGFRCPVGKHVGKGMMVKTLQDGILKLNQLLLNELFKWRKTHTGWGW
jgi:hypothetical protein